MSAMDYGCLYCRTGYERNVVNYLLDREIRAISPIKIRFRRRGGEKILEKVSLFPGYVLFAVDDGVDFSGFSPDFWQGSDDDPLLRDDRIRHVLRLHSDVIKILYDGDFCWTLNGDDRAFAEKLFAVNGEIGISKASYVGDRIHIRKGFLEEYEGSITAVNRRAKTACITVTIKDKVFRLWLGYEEIRDDLTCEPVSPAEEETVNEETVEEKTVEKEAVEI